MARTFIRPLLLACLAWGSAQAQAGVVEFQGFANGSQTVNYQLSVPNPSASGSTSAGGFKVLLDGTTSVMTYCIDLLQHISLGGSYDDYTEVAGSAHVFANTRAHDDIGRLFSAGHEVNDATEQAAFQIAIWELAYETSPTSYDVDSGAARFFGGTAANGALALADDWLSNLGSINNVSVRVLESPSHQDQVFANPVPEPSSAALIMAAMLSLGFVQRRRSSRHG